MRSDVMRSLSPMMGLSRIFGLMPVKFTFHLSGRFTGNLHLPEIIYGIALVIIGISAQSWGIYRDLGDGWKKSSRFTSLTFIVVSVCDMFATIGSFTAAILFSPYRWAHLEKAVNDIIKVNEALNDIKTSRDHRKLSIILILASMIPTLVFLSADFATWVSWIDPNYWGCFGVKGHINFLPLYFMKFVALVMELQMAIIIISVNELFDKINTVLRNLIQLHNFNKYFRKDFAWGTPRDQKATTSTVSPQDSLVISEKTGAWDSKPRNKGNLIYKLTTLHSTMCDCVASINKAYGPTMLVISWSLLLYFITTSYTLLVYAVRWYIVVGSLCWLIFYAYSLVLLVQPCHSLIIKAKTTGELVSRALLQDWDSDVEIQLEIFSNLLLQKRVEITACGLFTIDRGLIASIVGTVTTYLVILVQSNEEFGPPSPAPSNASLEPTTSNTQQTPLTPPSQPETSDNQAGTTSEAATQTDVTQNTATVTEPAEPTSSATETDISVTATSTE
ncbi:hypothetical protein QAD02_006174 [Eretmocerus hayati]|uniref:Uncharacterized protein n=1 Tax=Eretmocerus hayati TaxID=131215 RepID=A0ACC2N2H1_9HYME|nr:hypothetical protein QAD02_006174 [Eretmocerus hayati]